MLDQHYQNQILESYIKQNYIDIFISHEPNILGTGGAIKKIQNDDLSLMVESRTGRFEVSSLKNITEEKGSEERFGIFG